MGWIKEAAAPRPAPSLINPAGFTSTSIAILDALLIFDGPIIECHISPLFRRDEFRHLSYVSKAATAKIEGFGIAGYGFAITRIAQLIKPAGLKRLRRARQVKRARAGGTVRLGLIGDNIARSQSPRLHEIAGRLTDIPVTYERLVPKDMGRDFEAVFEEARSAGYRGLNITYPYKEKVVPLLSVPDPQVAALGAVNTVVFADGRARGLQHGLVRLHRRRTGGSGARRRRAPSAWWERAGSARPWHSGF